MQWPEHPFKLQHTISFKANRIFGRTIVVCGAEVVKLACFRKALFAFGQRRLNGSPSIGCNAARGSALEPKRVISRPTRRYRDSPVDACQFVHLQSARHFAGYFDMHFPNIVTHSNELANHLRTETGKCARRVTKSGGATAIEGLKLSGEFGTEDQ